MTISRFGRAVSRFLAMHAEDPKRVTREGQELPEALHYHQRLAHWLAVVAPDADVSLRLAAHCQHVQRWTIPRTDFPPGVTGYKSWRATLARFHADTAAAVLSEVGYDAPTIARVRALLTKKGLKHDPEVQRFEDAICLVFIETQLAAFADKHDDPKLLGILAKTWAKMTPRGHAEAAKLAAALPARVQGLLQTAISSARTL